MLQCYDPINETPQSVNCALEATLPPQPPKCNLNRDACSAWTSRSQTRHLNSNRTAPAAIKVGVYGGTLWTNQSWAAPDIDLVFGTCFPGRVWGNLGTICQPITENTAICAHWHCVLIGRLHGAEPQFIWRLADNSETLHFLDMRAIRPFFVFWLCSPEGVTCFVNLDWFIRASWLTQPG